MAGKIDKLVRSFLSSSNSVTEFDRFKDLQDPTYMSFKVDFFPLLGMSYLDDSYSSGGLFRRPGSNANTGDTDIYGDSAAEYLGNIGSPTRQGAHRAFVNMLSRIQDEAPWYFQSVTGLGDMYKIDPAQNFRAKDKVLAFECLESIDMRMSYMADLYRSFAFDTQWHREILPINLRTFNMEIHVLEFRTFNTTFGKIADYYAKGIRPVQGENNQKSTLNSNTTNPSIGSQLFNNATDATRQITNAIGGVSGIFGPQAQASDLTSAFEAISVQTFLLKDCEFDFYSEAPGYLENVSVKDATEATFKFKINVGRIEKRATYPFLDFMVGEYIKSTAFNTELVNGLPIPNGGTTVTAQPYIEDRPTNTLETMISPSDLRESIYETTSGKQSVVDAYNEQVLDESSMRRGFLERALNKVVRTATENIDARVNAAIGELTGGVLGTTPLGNVYGKPPLIDTIRTGLIDFLTPGEQNPRAETDTDFILNDAVNALEKPRATSSGRTGNILDKPTPTPNLSGRDNTLDRPTPTEKLRSNDILEEPTNNTRLGRDNIYR